MIRYNHMCLTFHLIVAIIQNASLPYLDAGLEKLTIYLWIFEEEEGALHYQIWLQLLASQTPWGIDTAWGSCQNGDSESVVLVHYLGLCESSKLPGNAGVDAAGPRILLSVARIASALTSCSVRWLQGTEHRSIYCCAYNYTESFFHPMWASKWI